MLNWLIIVAAIAAVITIWRIASPPSMPKLPSEAFKMTNPMQIKERQDKGVIGAAPAGVLLQRKTSLNQMLQSED